MLRLCERFGCLPSALEEESAELFYLLRLEALAHPERSESVEGW